MEPAEWNQNVSAFTVFLASFWPDDLGGENNCLSPASPLYPAAALLPEQAVSLDAQRRRLLFRGRSPPIHPFYPILGEIHGTLTPLILRGAGWRYSRSRQLQNFPLAIRRALGYCSDSAQWSHRAPISRLFFRLLLDCSTVPLSRGGRGGGMGHFGT